VSVEDCHQYKVLLGEIFYHRSYFLIQKFAANGRYLHCCKEDLLGIHGQQEQRESNSSGRRVQSFVSKYSFVKLTLSKAVKISSMRTEPESMARSAKTQQDEEETSQSPTHEYTGKKGRGP
jgi:hypothetical protein